MLRIRLGSTWKQDPALRASLARGGAAARAAASRAVDAIALEVDGVDLGSGRAEAPLLPTLEALGEALLRLLAGATRAEVHFPEGGLELLVARRDGAALLTLVAMERPARVLARDVEVDLGELTGSVAAAARTLALDLRSLQPSSPDPVAGSLDALADRLEEARPAPVEAAPPRGRSSSHRPRRHPDAPVCAFELHDAEGAIGSYRGPGADLGALLAAGRVQIRTADGRGVASLSGPPFLVLRDLVAFARAIADAARRGERTASAELAAPGRDATLELEADLAAGTLRAGEAAPLRCPALPLARALCEAALDLCGVVVARNPWQLHNGWVTELRAAAAEQLAHLQELIAGDAPAAAGAVVRRRRAPRLPRAPLGPGRVRRLRFRRAWQRDVGPPAGAGLFQADGGLVAAGSAAVVGLGPRDGHEAWRRPGARDAFAAGGALVLVDAAGAVSVDPATGRERWAAGAELLPDGGVRQVVRLAGGLTLVVGRGAARAFDPAGRLAWEHAPPAALALRALALGALAVVGSDAGFLYGVEAASGSTAWRLRLPGPLVAPPATLGRECLVLCSTDRGGSLVAVDPSTGRRRFELPLDVTPSGEPLAFAGLLGVAGLVAGDPVVVAIDPGGRLAWEDAPPLGTGPVALAPLDGGVLATTAHGACAALDRDGGTVWARAREAAHPPPRNVAPVVGRGIALVASDEVEALDVATGTLLGRAPLGAPVHLLADAHLDAWGIDADGLVTAVRLETHLSVV